MNSPVKSALIRFWQLLTPDKKEVWQIYLYSVFYGMVALSLPLGIQAIFNLVQGGRISASLVLLIIFVVGGIAFSGLLQIGQLYLSEKLQQKIFTKAAFEFAVRIPKLRLEAIDNDHAPELVNRFFDILGIQKGLSKSLIDFPAAILQITFGLILLSFYHPGFIIFGFFVLLVIYLILWLNVPGGLRTSLEESTYKYKVVHWLEEVARTIYTFKTAGRTDFHLSKTDKHVVGYLSARKEHFKILSKQYVGLIVFKMLIAAVLLSIGGWLVIDRQLGLGQFVASEIVILMIMSSVERLIHSLDTIYDVLSSLEKVGYFTDIELDEKKADFLLPDATTGIAYEVKDLCFSYPNEQVQVLSNITFNANPGDVICMSGYNGSGKNTLLRILAGFYDSYSGNLIVDGMPLKNIDIESFRNQISDSIGDQHVFSGTFLENIGIGRPNITFTDIQKVARFLKLEEIISNSPQGYETQIGPDGMRLSRSETAKVIFARCLVNKPRLLLIDDSILQFEESFTKEVLNKMVENRPNCTFIINSNKLSLAKMATTVLIMQKGQLVQKGSYEELKDNKLFKDIFHA